MAKRSWNSFTLRAEMDGAEKMVTAQLEKAGVLTASVAGKSVAISEAGLPDLISALIAVHPAEANQQQNADLVVTNADLARRLEKSESDLAIANGTVGGLQNEKRDLAARAAAAEASVQTLTAEKGQLNVQLNASAAEFSRVSREQASLNTEISKACLAIGCLQLTDTNGAVLKATASESEKVQAADKIPASDKFKAFQGGLHNAIAATGLNPASIPGAPLTFTRTTPAGILSQLEAITDPMERASFHSKNSAAIFAAMKALRS